MRLWTCTNHNSHYPVGRASITIAENEEDARKLLDSALIEDGLKPSSEDPYDLEEIHLDVAQAIVLVDGNY